MINLELRRQLVNSLSDLYRSGLRMARKFVNQILSLEWWVIEVGCTAMTLRLLGQWTLSLRQLKTTWSTMASTWFPRSSRMDRQTRLQLTSCVSFTVISASLWSADWQLMGRNISLVRSQASQTASSSLFSTTLSTTITCQWEWITVRKPNRQLHSSQILSNT